jgi:hypothetical protein
MKYSLAPFILRRPWLARFFKPAATWYVNTAGYRQMGLKYANSPSLLRRQLDLETMETAKFWDGFG